MMTREKILPEDLIQKTNLQQHNYMIGAINEIDERQRTVEDITAAATARVAALSRKHDTDIADLEEELAAFPSEVQTMIIDSFNAHLQNVLVDAGMLRFSPDRKAIFLQKNRRDGAVVDEQIPISTRQNVGLATPEDLLAIDNLNSRVTTLENSGITGELFYLDHDFSGVTDAVRTVHFAADIGKPPITGDAVIDNQKKSWRYVITGPTTFGWVEVPHLSIGGDLQAVKSSNAEGKVYVESDNTCSVVGWNGVKNDVSSNANAITGHAGNTTNPHSVTKAQIGLGAYPASPADIGISTATQTALDAKADVSALDAKADVSALDAKANKLVLLGTHDMASSTLEIGPLYVNQRVFVEVFLLSNDSIATSSGSGVLTIKENDNSSVFFSRNNDYGLFRIRFESVSGTCQLRYEQLTVNSTAVRWSSALFRPIRVRVYAMD